MEIKTAADALKMYRWASKKWHEELDAAAAIASAHTQPSEWRKRRRQEESSTVAFGYATKFSALKRKYWAAYLSLGGTMTMDAVDQEVVRSRHNQRAAK